MVNFLLKRIVIIHGELHWFREGRGIGTATLEANLAQQQDVLAHEPLFQVLLDVHKAYDSLNKGRYLDILR